MSKKSSAKPPKGTRDFLPEEVRRREYVSKIIRDVYEAHGFLPLETPAFERLEALLGKYGEEGDQLLFKILQRGQPLVLGIRAAHAHLEAPGGIVVGRSGETAPGAEALLADMGLRYDLTVPLARVYAEYQGKVPSVFKRYQIQPVWRADTPGKGRFREFYQCDVDVVGATSSLVECEVASAVAECLQRLGFQDFKIRLNDRRLLRAFIDRAGIDVSLETQAIVALDKLDKIGESGVQEELARHGIGPESQKRLLSFVAGDVSLEKVRHELGDHAVGQTAVGRLEEILALGATTAAKDALTFSPSLARGLGYYTGAIFEIAVPDLAGSLGGGGRYDGLIGMFLGRDVPACGFSIGFERILVVMEERKMFAFAPTPVDVVLASEDAAALPRLLPLARALRSSGLRVDVHPEPLKLSKARKDADERGVPAVVTLSASRPEAGLWLKAEPDVRDRWVALEQVQSLLLSSSLR